MQPETNGVKAWQWVVGAIVVILIVILGIYLFKGNGSSTTNTTETPAVTDTSAPVASNNGIIVSDQYPGNIVYISSVQLSSAGYVFIKADNKGVPGSTIGSKAFPKGINPGQVNLTKSMVDGGTYYAALYSDSMGTTAVTDSTGKAIMRIFHASANIPEVKG